MDSRLKTQQNSDPAILLYRGTSAIDRLIQWQTRSVYSHAAIWQPNGNIIESANGIGVRVRAVPKGISAEEADIFDVPATEAQWMRAIDFCHAELGCKYDWIGIARFITRRPGGDDNRWFCSELVAAAFVAAGLPLLERIQPWAISPGLLAVSPLLRPRA